MGTIKVYLNGKTTVVWEVCKCMYAAICVKKFTKSIALQINYYKTIKRPNKIH
jgi:hypothetical protein